MESLPAGRVGSARRARVIGAPSTRKIGASIESTMCWIMWTLNSSIP